MSGTSASPQSAVVVTGGAGFIGSNLVDSLLARGHRVVVLDNLSTGRRDNLTEALERGAELHEIDVTDAAAVSELLLRERPRAVFHLAAQIDVRRSVDDPAADARVNVEGTVNVLSAAHAAGVGRVVYSATGGAVYGEAETIPTPEEAPALPLSPYGQSKLSGEGYCALFARLHGLSTVALRYSNVYGPRQDPLGEGGVIAIFCGAFAHGRTPTIYGDGEQTRDYLYVEDVVAANLLAADGDVTGCFNVATGVETSVLDLVAAFRGLDGGEGFAPVHAPARAGEVVRSCLDATRARAALGWEPSVDLAAGLSRTLAFQAAVA
ncbi:NAD-dependent epimerase/dehydratase family protein [Conexibacter stalactiti]|uniref:GDP-mannose 4,6-dehydratase n=1 Tax=Conexibacter stalactiti TaxID=1940611 RepID=A0ABU4HUY9_9ACTN|nr:NAD-dependent epimerase/dehydratase family protein [Conexibacter stalactiti]MDW5596360.1 GDP-mannose 4,6-dehydratase [Conexibacter stalactiti]MEC5037002.1 NAD-dependent epimerase/dehydratase family protein [Conexibacter stalactiti]